MLLLEETILCTPVDTMSHDVITFIQNTHRLLTSKHGHPAPALQTSGKKRGFFFPVAVTTASYELCAGGCPT